MIKVSPLIAGRASWPLRLVQRRIHSKRQQSTHQNEAEATSNPPTITPPTSNETSRTIPGPIWLWTQPLESYSRAHKRRPYTVQVIAAGIIYFIGDLTAQKISPSPSKNEDESSDGNKAFSATYDPARTVRSLIIGTTAAIPGYHWFLYLARNFNYASKAGSIVVKVLVNQMMFTPMFNSYFFGMQSLLSGASVEDVVERIRHTVPRSWYNSWKLWPVVTAFSFAFIRVELRGVFAGEL